MNDLFDEAECTRPTKGVTALRTPGHRHERAHGQRHV